MRPVFLVIITSLFINASTELHQFLRIPLLLEHYREHRKETPSLSFFDFLKLHYTDRHPDDNDEEEDNQLPFKSSGDINHTDISFSVLHEAIQKPYTYLKQSWPVYKENIPENPINLIFHPPRNSTF